MREGPAPIPWDADAMPDEATDDSFVGGLPHGDQSRLARHRNSVEQLSAGIYGTVISSATMAAAASLPLGGVVLGGLTTILVYWVAEQYASGLAHHAVVGRVTAADVLRAFRERFTMVGASFVPLLTVLAVGALGASVSTAVTAGLVVAAASIAVLGAVAARRSGLSAVGTLLAGLFAAALGGAVVLLKLALH